MTRPIIPLFVALASGISFGSLLTIPDVLLQSSLVVALVLVLLGLIKKWVHVHRVALLSSLFILGVLEMNMSINPYHRNDHITHFIGDEKMTVEGIVCDTPQVTQEKTDLIVAASRVIVDNRYLPASGRLLLSIREPYPFRYGDVIRFHAKLRLPHNFHNPGGFDYEGYLRVRGILVRGFVNDSRAILVLRRDMGNPLWSHIERFRDLIRNTVRKSSPGIEGAVIQAMILGDQKEIPQDVMEKFNRTGTTHIIAISGFNIGIVAFFSLLVVRLLLKSSEYILLRWDIRRIASLFAILVIAFYTFVAGSGISVIRASVMVVLFMLAFIIDRERDLYNTLALAAFTILIVTPYSLFDVSFQLSFVAVASILFITPKLIALLPPRLSIDTSRGLRERLARHGEGTLRSVIIFFFASLSATLGTLPLILLYFNRLSLVTLAANLIVVPILGIIAIPFCLLVVLTAPISVSLSDIIIRISAELVRISLSLIDWFAAFPWSSVYVTTPTLLEIVAFYLLVLSGGFLLDQSIGHRDEPKREGLFRWKIIPFCLILFFIINGILLHLRNQQAGILSLTAIDVGQGSATLIRFPGGRKMVVDGGGFFDETFNVGKYVMAPFLWHERIDMIDTVVLTHPHPDHLQGLLFILENFRVREVWTNGDVVDSPPYESFLDIVRKRDILLKVVSDRTPDLETSGVTIRILNPPPKSAFPGVGTPSSTQGDSEALEGTENLPRQHAIRKGLPTSDETNNRSLVIRLSFGERSFLLPGDISEISEWRLTQSTSDLRSDVLFVPHHGGARSSTMPFIEKVKPQVAIISCGWKNVFRVPHPDVLGRYKRMQSRIYRTDRDGAVTITTDGRDLQIDSFRSGSP